MYILNLIFISKSFANPEKKEFIEKLNCICSREKYEAGGYKQKINILAALQIIYFNVVFNDGNNKYFEKLGCCINVCPGTLKLQQVEVDLVGLLKKSFYRLNTKNVPTRLVKINEGIMQILESVEDSWEHTYEYFNDLFAKPAEFVKGDLSLEQIYKSYKENFPLSYQWQLYDFPKKTKNKIKKVKFLTKKEYGTFLDLVRLVYSMRNSWKI